MTDEYIVLVLLKTSFNVSSFLKKSKRVLKPLSNACSASVYLKRAPYSLGYECEFWFVFKINLLIDI